MVGVAVTSSLEPLHRHSRLENSTSGLESKIVTVPLFTSVGIDFDKLYMDKEMIDSDGIDITIISKEHLTQMLAASDREKDRKHIESLERWIRQ